MTTVVKTYPRTVAHDRMEGVLHAPIHLSLGASLQQIGTYNPRGSGDPELRSLPFSKFTSHHFQFCVKIRQF